MTDPREEFQKLPHNYDIRGASDSSVYHFSPHRPVFTHMPVGAKKGLCVESSVLYVVVMKNQDRLLFPQCIVQ